MVRKAANTGLDKLRDVILEYRRRRDEIKAMEDEQKSSKPEIITKMHEFGANNQKGIVLDDINSKEGTAFVAQNKGSEFWDVEGIISYLRSPIKRHLWMSCSSRSLDIKKWEAEIANGNIPAQIARKFKMTGEPPAPYIRFGKGNENSI